MEVQETTQETPIKMRMVRPGRVFIVYKTINTKTHEYYIGQHRQRGFEFDGYYGSGSAMRDNIKKHDKDSFNREILHSYFTRNESQEMEKKLITQEVLEDSLCLNMRPGGIGGGDHSEETKLKMSESAKGKKMSPEAIAKTAQANRGRKATPEHCAKISKALKGKKKTPEHIVNSAEANKGRKATPEHCAKISKAHRGVKLSPEHIANAAEGHRKINDDQIQEIIRLRKTGIILKDIAKIYGVAPMTIGNYLRKYQSIQK